MTALALAVLAERAGVPPGVFSVVTGSAADIGNELCAHIETFLTVDAVCAMRRRPISVEPVKLSLRTAGWCNPRRAPGRLCA